MHTSFSITCLVQNSLFYLRMFHMVSVSVSLVLEAIKHPCLPPSCRHPWISEGAPLHILQTSTLIERVLSPAQLLSEGLPYVTFKGAFGNFQKLLDANCCLLCPWIFWCIGIGLHCFPHFLMEFQSKFHPIFPMPLKHMFAIYLKDPMKQLWNNLKNKRNKPRSRDGPFPKRTWYNSLSNYCTIGFDLWLPFRTQWILYEMFSICDLAHYQRELPTVHAPIESEYDTIGYDLWLEPLWNVRNVGQARPAKFCIKSRITNSNLPQFI